MGQWRGKCYYLGFGTLGIGVRGWRSNWTTKMEVAVRGLRPGNGNEMPTCDQVTC